MHWARRRFGSQWYWLLGFWPAAAGSVLAFLAAWALCAEVLGYLGAALGWLPAIVIGGIAYYLVRVSWAPLAGLAGLGLILLCLA